MVAPARAPTTEKEIIPTNLSLFAQYRTDRGVEANTQDSLIATPEGKNKNRKNGISKNGLCVKISEFVLEMWCDICNKA